MATQGIALSEEEVQRIVTFLRSSELTIHEIATRMGCSSSCVVSVNRRFQIRDYSGLRSMWSVRPGKEDKKNKAKDKQG